MRKYGDWEAIEPPLGEGGQSVVYMARTPARVNERTASLQDIRTALDGDLRSKLATAIWTHARPDSPSELGALKVFKISPKGETLPQPPGSEEYEAIQRLKNEVAALREGRVGLPRLLDSSEEERWIVTELFMEGTLERHLSRYQGKVVPALRAFRSLVATVASLHQDRYVHRDIKPANVFVRKDDELVLGDFGIVYMPTMNERLTLTNERVGPRDYMPQWADLGARHEKVQPNFDVYMLGKLLWCMIAGRLKLPREYHKRQGFNLLNMFPGSRHMPLVNSILDKCVVEEPEHCLASAQDLLQLVDEKITLIDQGVPLFNQSGQLILPCRVCGRGSYQDSKAEVRLQPYNEGNMPLNMTHLRVFVCNVCTHHEFFARNYPEEAAQRGWTPWQTMNT